MSMKSFIVVVILLGLNLNLCKALESEVAARVRVQVEPSQEAFILGEPVVLNVTVTNTGPEPVRILQVLVEGTEPEINVYVSEDGIQFRKWMMGLLGVADIERARDSLAPNEPKHYTLRVLYDWERESHLVFEHSGRYWIKVRFPLAELEPPYNRTEIESNTFGLQIKDPQGADAKMLRQIQDGEFLPFLQTGRTGKETVLQAAALVKSMPNTAYHLALRSALQQYYEGYAAGVRKLDEHEAELLRSILRIDFPLPQPFPDDKRLDQIITYRFPVQTPLEEVFKEISQQSGVRLEIDLPLRIRTMSSLRVTEPLRRLMENTSVYKSEWVREGDGYLLKAADVPEGSK